MRGTERNWRSLLTCLMDTDSAEDGLKLPMNKRGEGLELVGQTLVTPGPRDSRRLGKVSTTVAPLDSCGTS